MAHAAANRTPSRHGELHPRYRDVAVKSVDRSSEPARCKVRRTLIVDDDEREAVRDEGLDPHRPGRGSGARSGALGAGTTSDWCPA